MSSYIQFRKKGVRICEFSRNSEMYKVFDEMVPYSEWHVVTADKLRQGILALQDEIGEKEDTILIYKEMMKANMSFSDAYEAAKTIVECQEDIEELDYYVNYIKVLMEIERCDNYDGQSPLEWTVG